MAMIEVMLGQVTLDVGHREWQVRRARYLVMCRLS